MKIFYTASYPGKQKYQKEYNLVLSAIEQQRVELISPEKSNHLSLLRKSERSLPELQQHYLAMKKGIEWSDAVIIEISQEDFQLGHEATLAILNKKHILCLSIHEDFSLKIINRYFHAARYTEYTVDNIVEDFIHLAKKELLLERFNCFLSRSQLQYLEKITAEEQVSKSEYIRHLIDLDQKQKKT